MTNILINGEVYYVTVEEVTAYATARGLTLVQSVPILVTQASDYFESLSFKGYKTSKTQPFQFPRKCLYIDCLLIEDDVVPQLTKDCICEIAIAIDQGYNPLSTLDRSVKYEKVDVISVSYSDDARDDANVRAIRAKLKKLINNSSGNMINVQRHY